MTPHEEWRPIVGYEGAYEVSNLGRMRSLPREVAAGQRGGTRIVPGRMLKTPLGRNGYRQVTLRKQTFMVHTLVALTFIGPRPNGYEICHNDGNGDNNAASNLRYDTVSANRLDTVTHGRNKWALRTHCSKGHPYTPENTSRNGRGRRCLTCHRDYERERNRRKAQSNATPLRPDDLRRQAS